jgi:putative transposase
MKAAGQRSWVVALGIMPGHVHLFVKAHPSHSPSPVASQYKGLTSWRLGTYSPHPRSGLSARWSRPCFAATVGVVPVQTVRQYVGTPDGRPWRKDRAQ